MNIMFGDNTRYSMKEMYNVVLKATQNMKIGNREIEKGEVIAEFDSISISNTQELKSHITANGGFDNRAWVSWDETREVVFSFTQGVFSNSQFGLLTNSRLIQLEPEGSKSLIIAQKEILESGDNGEIILKNKPFKDLFIYSKETGEKLNYTIIDDMTYQIEQPYTEVIVHYDYLYDNGSTIVVLGRRLITGYLSLEGRTRLKDDDTGRVVTGIVSIPKLKLMSDLFMRLGIEANPVVANFQAEGFPIGDKGSKEILNIAILNDDIDADM